MLLNNILYFMQIFLFCKITIKIKKLILILTNIDNLWVANFLVYNNYDLKTFSSIYTITKNNTSDSKIEDILESDIHIYDEFISIITRNKSAYIIFVKQDKW